MTAIAFVGLGIMDGPMAAHLVGAGFDVIGVNRSPASVEDQAFSPSRERAETLAAQRDSRSPREHDEGVRRLSSQ